MTSDERDRPGRTVEARILALDGATRTPKDDNVVTEEPLELRLVAGETTKTLAVTMRTPGNDFELAAGFVLSEGDRTRRRTELVRRELLHRSLDRRRSTLQCRQRRALARNLPDLHALRTPLHDQQLMRGLRTRAISIAARAGITPITTTFASPIPRSTRFQHAMREAQRIFAATGGLHAAALFAATAAAAVREDIGRHNAVDKLIGWGLLYGKPLSAFAGLVLMVSGRAAMKSYKRRGRAHSGRLRRLGSKQPRRRSRPRVQHHARRVRTRQPRQRL